jgi:hypothetical protein
MIQAARLIMIFGVILLVVGGLLYLVARSGISLGRLPGNITIQGNNFTCVFALGASILLSILLTIILNVVARIFK